MHSHSQVAFTPVRVVRGDSVGLYDVTVVVDACNVCNHKRMMAVMKCESVSHERSERQTRDIRILIKAIARTTSLTPVLSPRAPAGVDHRYGYN
jgi:hypothetical protein